MGSITRDIKPLYSRILALNIDKYLLSRQFKLATIELDIDESWNNYYITETNKHGSFPNYSIIAEIVLGQLIADFTKKFNIYKIQEMELSRNGKQFEKVLESYKNQDIEIRKRFFDIISYILIDFAKWNNLQNDYSAVFEALEMIGYNDRVLEPLNKKISMAQINKPKKSAALDLTKEFDKDFWKIINKRIVDVSKEKFVDGYYSDSVFTAVKELNYQVKKIVKNKTGEEIDGVALMRRAFQIKNNLIQVGPDLTSDTGKDTQEGFMQLYAGVCQGIRNPNAHESIEIDKDTAVHHLFLISLLMNRLDEAKY